jgi:transposase InsO family protein
MGLLEQFGMKASISRKGNCYDNAAIESGGLSNRSLFITVGTEPGRKQFRTLRNISRSFTTANQKTGSLWTNLIILFNYFSVQNRNV